MSDASETVETRIHLSTEQANQLHYLAHERQITEDQLVSAALDLYFSLSQPADTAAERQGWSSLSEQALARVWDNDEDAAYDNWKELYGISAR